MRQILPSYSDHQGQDVLQQAMHVVGWLPYIITFFRTLIWRQDLVGAGRYAAMARLLVVNVSTNHTS